jgi:hypothetical protein
MITSTADGHLTSLAGSLTALCPLWWGYFSFVASSMKKFYYFLGVPSNAFSTTSSFVSTESFVTKRGTSSRDWEGFDAMSETFTRCRSFKSGVCSVIRPYLI